jgi:8-oxo-dGTP diphosphatase
VKRKYPNAPIAAVGVLVRSGDQVLLIRRGKDPFKGYWTLPGGAIELGETAREAARREAQEETGLEVDLGEIATLVDNIVRDEAGRIAFHYVIVDFCARPAGGTLRPGSDVTDVRWVGRDELDTLPITEKAGSLLRGLLGTPEPDAGSA